MSFRQDRTNPSTAVSNWHGRSETPKGWPSTRVSTWINGGLFGAGGGTGTYEPIATATGDNSSDTISFTSIPDTYSDLKVWVTRNGNSLTTGADTIALKMNDEQNYNSERLMMAGSSISWEQSSSNGAAAWESVSIQVYSTSIAGSMPSVYTLDICNYAGASHNKPMFFQGGNPKTAYVSSSWGVGMGVLSMNANSSTEYGDITKITIQNGSGSKWQSADHAVLFGIKDS